MLVYTLFKNIATFNFKPKNLPNDVASCRAFLSRVAPPSWTSSCQATKIAGNILGGREKRSPEPTTATHLSTSNVARASSGRLSELSRAWILNSSRWIRLNHRRIFPGYLARPPSGRGELMSRGSGATILRDRNQLGAFDRIRAIREGKGKRSAFLEDSASDGPESPDPPTPPRAVPRGSP